MHKELIRHNTLLTLANPHKGVRFSAAQAVAAIAGFDVPSGAWTALLPILF